MMQRYESNVTARPSAGVPGAPFMPLATVKTDTQSYYRPPPTDTPASRIGLDAVGQDMFKTMANVVVDDASSDFFSQSNLDHLQDGIHSAMEKRGYIIDRQDDRSLLLIMRKVFLSKVFGNLKEWNEQSVKEACAIITRNIEYSDIHIKLKMDSFSPLEYGVSDVSSVRGVLH